MSDVKAAMTAEEWEAKTTRQDPALYGEGATRLLDYYNADVGDPPTEERLVVYGESGWRYPIADRHATAALALHGQPFGFTHADVDAIRRVLAECHVVIGYDTDWIERVNPTLHTRLVSLADRLEALLPPSDAAR